MLSEDVKGDKLSALEAIRDRLAEELEGDHVCVRCGGAGSSGTAALAKQLVDVLERIAAIKPPEVSELDDIASQRAKRRGAAPASDAPARKGKQRAGGRAAGGKRGAAS